MAALSAPLIVSATSLHVVKGNTEYVIAASPMWTANYSSGTISIMGESFLISEITKMYVSEDDVKENTVIVNYNGDSASIIMSRDLVSLVSCTMDGAHVNLVQSDNVNESTGEITYILSGASEDGSFNLTGSYKATIELQGLDLTNKSGAPLNIKNGKRIAVSAKNSTVNNLTDGEGSQKGAISCTGHLEFKGKGTLNVTGNVGHAVYAKEYVEMKNCTLNVLSAPKDGINCTQYFLLESGKLNIRNVEGDGVQVDFKDAENREEEDTGKITLAGGTVDMAITGIAMKGFKAEGDLEVTGGEIKITSSGNGEYDEKKAKTKASACLGADGNVTISGGLLNLSASGSGGKGISCDGNLNYKGGEMEIHTSGGILVYSNGSLNHNYTGNTDRIASDMKSSPKGVKADGEIVIDGGSIKVTTTGKGAEGIESKSTLVINDGSINVFATDDCINSASHMTINGGDILVVSTGNDGLDTNGSMYINGGVIRAFGAGSPECGLDVNEEERQILVITGGYVLGVGGNNSVPTTAANTQPYVHGSLKVTSGTPIVIAQGNDDLYTFEVPTEYVPSSSTGGFRPGGSSSGQKVFISVPGMTTSTSYKISCGTASSTVTSTLKGSSSSFPW